MANEVALFGNQQLPAHLQGTTLGVTTQLLAGMFTGGNRIGFKGSRFHIVVSGVEEGVVEESYLDVIMLSAAPAVSRKFYAGSYSAKENAPPACYSADGITPAADVKTPQSTKCATCPQNVKGSKIDGANKYKACAYFRRLVVMMAGDVEAQRIFKFDVAAQGLFGENNANSKNLNDYIKMLESRGVDAGTVVTRVTFDIDSSVPKLLFRPQRYIDADEYEVVKELVASEEVRKSAEVNMTTIDISEEDTNTGAQQADPEPEPPAKPQRTAQTVKPATQAPARAEPQQAATPAKQQTQAPQRATQAPAKPAPKPEPEPEIIEISGDAELDALLASMGD